MSVGHCFNFSYPFFLRDLNRLLLQSPRELADTLLEPARLASLVRERWDGDRAELIRVGEETRREALRQIHRDQPEYPDVASHSEYTFGATVFGRYHSILMGLESLLPDRPRRIAEIGAGIVPYRRLLERFPGFLEFLQQHRGVTVPAAVYEPFELARLARDGGVVDLWEMDARIVSALAANQREGIFLVPDAILSLLTNPFLQAPSIDENFIRRMSAWVRYAKDFESDVHRHVEKFSTQDQKLIGELVTFRAGFPEIICRSLEDFSVARCAGPYDLGWAMQVYPYTPIPLWMASLVKLTGALEIGALLVTDNFFDDLEGAAPGLLEGGIFGLMGLEVVSMELPPLQTAVPRVAVARKTDHTPWLQDKLMLLQSIGLS